MATYGCVAEWVYDELDLVVGEVLAYHCVIVSLYYVVVKSVVNKFRPQNLAFLNLNPESRACAQYRG